MKRFRSASEAIAALQAQGYQVIATSPHARNIQALAPLQAKPIALVVGNETTGIADDIIQSADVVVQIPMGGQAESLNVGVATGISLYELKFRMVLTMLIDFIRANMGREVNVTGQLIQQAFDSQIKNATDLSGQQVILLMILICDHMMSLEQVTRDIGVYGEALIALLQPLLARGYIQYAPDQPDAIVATEAGEHTIAKLWSLVERAEQAILNGFSPEERTQFMRYLQRIQANCLQITE